MLEGDGLTNLEAHLCNNFPSRTSPLEEWTPRKSSHQSHLFQNIYCMEPIVVDKMTLGELLTQNVPSLGS